MIFAMIRKAKTVRQKRRMERGRPSQKGRRAKARADEAAEVRKRGRTSTVSFDFSDFTN